RLWRVGRPADAGALIASDRRSLSSNRVDKKVSIRARVSTRRAEGLEPLDGALDSAVCCIARVPAAVDNSVTAFGREATVEEDGDDQAEEREENEGEHKRHAFFAVRSPNMGEPLGDDTNLHDRIVPRT